MYCVKCNGAVVYTTETGNDAMKLASITKDTISHGVQYRCGWFHRVDEIPLGSGGYMIKWTENEKKEEVIIKVERMES